MIKENKVFKQGIGIVEKSQETRRDSWCGNLAKLQIPYLTALKCCMAIIIESK